MHFQGSHSTPPVHMGQGFVVEGELMVGWMGWTVVDWMGWLSRVARVAT